MPCSRSDDELDRYEDDVRALLDRFSLNLDDAVDLLEQVGPLLLGTAEEAPPPLGDTVEDQATRVAERGIVAGEAARKALTALRARMGL